MWADNEVSIDLLNVTHLTAAVLTLVADDNVAPVTIGVYGDWGSGKSTVLRLVESALTTKGNQDAGIVCVWFNSWQFETYDDAKAALMSAILEKLRAERGAFETAKSGLQRLAKRIEWMRLAGLAGMTLVRAKVALLTAGLSEVAKSTIDAVKEGAGADGVQLATLIKEDEEAEGLGPQSIRQFREEFAKLLDAADVSRLVIIIDDLDRCLPERVVDTLEAIKLFLLVPKTAFVIGADEGLIRRSVQARFAAVADAKEQLGRDYLEKLIQIPVPVPPMSQEEAEGYMNLLFTQLRLGKSAFNELCERRSAEALPAIGKVSFSYEDAKKYLGTVPDALQQDFALVGQIGSVLAAHTAGNPRQTKRFLNTLMLRLEMAKARGVNVYSHIMAKLMLLEYVRREAFNTLADWQRGQSGKPTEIRLLEDAASGSTAAPLSDARVQAWLDDEWLRRWIGSEPKLTEHDLAPYFYFAHTRLSSGLARQRLSPAAEIVFDALQDEAEHKRLAGSKAAADLSDVEASAVFAALADRIAKQSEKELAKDYSPLMALFGLVAARPALIGELITLLGTTLPQILPAKTLSQLATLTTHTQYAPAAHLLLTDWETKAKMTKVGKGAAATRDRIKLGPRPAKPLREGR
jgi:hypothetical protein